MQDAYYGCYGHSDGLYGVMYYGHGWLEAALSDDALLFDTLEDAFDCWLKEGE